MVGVNETVGVRVGLGVIEGVRVAVGVCVNPGRRSIYHRSAMAVLVAFTFFICCSLRGKDRVRKPAI